MKRKWFSKFKEQIASTYLFKILFLFGIYFALGKLGLLAQNKMEFKNEIWPATGAAFSLVLIWGYSLWPAILLATILLNPIIGKTDIPLIIQVAANCIEVLFAVSFCLRGMNFKTSLNRMSDVIRLIQSALLSGLLGASVIAFGLLTHGSESVDIFYFLQYWSGHSIGFFMLAPLFLTLSNQNVIQYSEQDLESIFEFNFNWKNLFSQKIISLFFLMMSGVFLLIKFNIPIRFYLYFPLILWPALRVGQKGVSLMVFIITLMIIFETVLGSWVSVNPLQISDKIYFFTFIILLQITGLIVGASIAERDQERVIKEKNMLSDISELKLNLSVLKKSKEAAEARSEAKTQFLTHVGHELRTPLAAILGFSEVLSDEKISEFEKKKYFEIIKRNGAQLLNVINDVLDLSKIEVGQFVIQKISISMEELVNDLQTLLTLEAEKKSLTLKFETDLNVPNKILTDPLRLRQILINIIGNAIKFTERGSIDIKIKTIIDQNGVNKVAFVVKDTGIGIPADKVVEVFSPFLQLSVFPTRRFGGTGLGLALSQRLARSLGGDIVLDKSTLGEGSQFTISIDPGDAIQIAQSEKAQKEAELEFKRIETLKVLDNKKILVVDDDLDNQALISFYLRSEGARVSVASDGAEAIQLVHTNQFDIILSDLLMPVIDGYAFVKSLRNEGYKKTIIALTAFELKEVRQRCLTSGFDDCIVKPIDKKNLIQSLIKKSA